MILGLVSKPGGGGGGGGGSSPGIDTLRTELLSEYVVMSAAWAVVTMNTTIFGTLVKAESNSKTDKKVENFFIFVCSIFPFIPNAIISSICRDIFKAR
ncbi:MAG: hypothetical protein ACTSQ3_06100 [Candidatus Heimdallarchaeota archaeon]